MSEEEKPVKAGEDPWQDPSVQEGAEVSEEKTVESEKTVETEEKTVSPAEGGGEGDDGDNG